MNCTIPASNLKILVKAVNALSKIGDELYFIGNKDALSMRTVNMSKTAFVTIIFKDIFFSTYDISELDTDSEGEDKCFSKVPMKSALSVFRTHSFKKDQKLEYCKIELQHEATKILFTFQYRGDVSIVRSLNLVEMESLKVMYRSEDTSISLCASSELFAQVLSSFQPSDTDMTMDVAPTKVVMKNFEAGDINLGKGVRTQMCLLKSEFNNFKMEDETTVTFSLRAFRAAVQFAEACNLNMTLNLQVNKPAVVVAKYSTFEATFVIATLNDSETQTTFVPQSTVKSKAKQPRPRPSLDVTREDQEALENVNWDDDADLHILANNVTSKQNGIVSARSSGRESFDDIMRRAKRKKDDDETVSKDAHQSEEDTVQNSPETSQNRIRRTIFERCYDTTYHRSATGYGDVLVPNSDPESDNDMDVG